MNIDQELIDFAHHLADVSGAIVKEYFRKDIQEEIKGDTSPVTIADKKIEEALRREIMQKYPEHGVKGEEFPETNVNADYKWVLDPIDGTISFVIGRPMFGTLIGLAYKGKPILGVIDQPIIQDRWIGYEGLANKTTRNTENIEDAILCAHSDCYFSGKSRELFDAVKSKTKYQKSGGVVYGGDCYLFGLLASGYIDIIIEAGFGVHDFMALIPVVESAGGIITDISGNNIDINSDGTIIACANKTLHNKIMNLIN